MSSTCSVIPGLGPLSKVSVTRFMRIAFPLFIPVREALYNARFHELICSQISSRRRAWAGPPASTNFAQYTFRANRLFFAFDVFRLPHDSVHGSLGWTRRIKRTLLHCLKESKESHTPAGNR